MKIRYEFLTKEVVEIEVSEGFGEIAIAIDKDIYNNNRKETRRHNSIEALHEDGIQAVDPTADVAAAVENRIRNEKLHRAVNQLLPQQQGLIQKVYFEERTLTEIAREEGVSVPAIRDRLNKIHKKLKKILGSGA